MHPGAVFHQFLEINDLVVTPVADICPRVIGFRYFPFNSVAGNSIYDVRGFFNKNAQKLQPVFDALGPNHWKNVNTLVDAYEAAGRVKAPTTIKMEQPKDPLEQATGSSFRRVLSLFKNIAQRFGSESDAAIVLAGGYLAKLSKESTLKALDDAIYNPELAALMIEQAKHPTLRNTEALKKMLHGSQASLAGIAEAHTTEQRKRQTGQIPPPPRQEDQ